MHTSMDHSINNKRRMKITTAMEIQTNQRTGWLFLTDGILGITGIIFSIALTANFAVPGLRLEMLWTMAFFGIIAGIVMIILASPVFNQIQSSWIKL